MTKEHEDLYCTDCGEDENISFVAQYASGDYWKCNSCGKSFHWDEPKEEDYEESKPQLVDNCACGGGGKIYSGETCYEFDEYSFKEAICIAKYAGAKIVTRTPYK